MRRIESRSNQVIKELMSLKHKKHRKEKRCFIAEGFRFVQEALLSGAEVQKICFSSAEAEKFYPEIEPLLNQRIQCFTLSEGLFGQLTDTGTPQGILAEIHMPFCSLESCYKEGFRGLMMDGVQDPGNVGTMIRSAHAMGFDAVVATKGTVDIYNEKVLRATMGSLFNIPVVDSMETEDIILFCHAHDLRVFVSRMKNAVPCHEMDLSGGFFLVVGNEGKGVSPAIAGIASDFCYIPMPGGAESLNAAMAATILMYESNRQRQQDRGRFSVSF